MAAPRLDETEEIDVVRLDEPAAAVRGNAITMMPTACAVGLALLALESQSRND